MVLHKQNHVAEPPHDKTNKVACAPIKDSDQYAKSDQCPLST